MNHAILSVASGLQDQIQIALERSIPFLGVKIFVGE